MHRPIKERLVAKKGQLVTIAEQAGEAPNATGNGFKGYKGYKDGLQPESLADGTANREW